MDKFILIDGNSLINRAFYALPPLSTTEGVPSQAVYGFTTMLIKMIHDYSPKYIAVAFDLPKPTFRHLKYADYKATRKKMPDDLAIQIPLLKKLLSEMGITILEKEGFEADDIIGTMAKKNSVMTYIITGDRDSLQLIDDTTKVVLTKRGITDILEVDEKVLKEEFSLTPAQVIEYKSLAGDSSDNIPGVKGVGEKTALALISQYGTLDNIYLNIDEIAGKLRDKLIENKEMAYLSHELATINIDVELDCAIESCDYKFPFALRLKQEFVRLNFKSLVKRDDIYDVETRTEVVSAKPVCEIRMIDNVSDLKEALSKADKEIALHIGNSINFAFDASTEYIVNLTYNLIDRGMEYNECLSIFKTVLEDEKVLKILFDAKNVLKILKVNKINPVKYYDVKLAQYLIDMTADYNTLPGMLDWYGLDNSEGGTGLYYLYNTTLQGLDKLNMKKLYFDIELPLIKVLFDMESEGFCVDIVRVNELGEKFSAKIDLLSKEIYRLAGKTFNINSPRQLGILLFDEMKIPYPKKSSSYSTSAEILEQVADQNEIIPLILEHRFVNKLNSTYIEGIKKLIDARGIVHTEFKQMLTSTGRLSSVEPNLQNIPVREEEGKALRGIFVARPDYTLVSSDYSQIELRLMAHLSGDEIMLGAYENNEDIHTSTAMEVFNVTKEQVTSKMRRDAKAVNFGIIYGISEYGLAQNLKISTKLAREYIVKYFDRFKGVEEYLKRSVEEAKKSGVAVTIMNRARKIPELYSSQYNTRQFGERVAMNMPLQGSAADIIKAAMIKVAAALSGMKSKLILQVHDELIVQASDDEVERVKIILKENMENAVQLRIPLTVDIGEGKSWLDC